jgi:hypothetical protein
LLIAPVQDVQWLQVSFICILCGKPLELLGSSNLLDLLKEYAGWKSQIEVPDNWECPEADAYFRPAETFVDEL